MNRHRFAVEFSREMLRKTGEFNMEMFRKSKNRKNHVTSVRYWFYFVLALARNLHKTNFYNFQTFLLTDFINFFDFLGFLIIMDLLQEQKIKKSIKYLHTCIKKKPVNINSIILYCKIVEDLTLLQPEDFNVNKKI